MSAATPGPWAIRRGHSVVEIRTTAGLPVAATAGGDYWKNFSDEALANARLIAAAPDLLAALTELLADTQHVRHNCGDPDCPVDVARQVVARATGETA